MVANDKWIVNERITFDGKSFVIGTGARSLSLSLQLSLSFHRSHQTREREQRKNSTLNCSMIINLASPTRSWTPTANHATCTKRPQLGCSPSSSVELLKWHIYPHFWTRCRDTEEEEDFDATPDATRKHSSVSVSVEWGVDQ